MEYVDPTMGGQGFLLEPTRPTVSLPNSMVRVYPVRKDQLDDQIHSFPLTIISHRLGELFWLMPGDGSPEAHWDRAGRLMIRKRRRRIIIPPGSMIRSSAPNSRPTARCGYFRFTFPSGQPVVLLANRRAASFPGGTTTHFRQRDVCRPEREFPPASCRLIVYGEFSAPVTSSNPDSDDGKAADHLRARRAGTTLEFRYGISFISVEQARKNLQEEIPGWNFDKVKARAPSAAGTTRSARFEVTGGTPEQKRVFYTSLYRCYERMVNITEDGQYYSAFDHQVHQDPRPFYVDNWLWDTYRALEPLQTLLNPEMEADKSPVLRPHVRAIGLDADVRRALGQSRSA